MKKISPKVRLGLFFLILFGVGTWLVVGKCMEFSPVEPEEDELDINTINQKFNATPIGSAVESTPTATSTASLPTEEDIIRTFFALIDEKRIPEAISMMSKKMIGDESSKQGWGVQFNAIEKIKVSAIEPAMRESWSENSHEYKVDLDVKVSANAADAPIPYYGWENGSNLRWVEIVKEDGLWKIDNLATGP